jgi:phosphoribosylglycinamide formyltransferase-1
MKPPPLRLGVIGSGKGSNFEAIAIAIRQGHLNAEVRLVLSDLPDAEILQKAKAFGVPARVLPTSKFRTKLEPEIELLAAQLLLDADVELVVLAGYMRLIKTPLLDRFTGRIVNIHPSLLPAFPGLEAWRQAMDARVEVTGCTVHWVDAGMDSGQIIASAEVPVRKGDTPEILHERIQQAEHILYPATLARIASQLDRTFPR